jgi:hypothetical protein
MKKTWRRKSRVRLPLRHYSWLTETSGFGEQKQLQRENIQVDRGGSRVSFETSFDSKQPKLEPELVSALSETECLFWVICFYTETEIFNVWIEPKQTEDQPKQFDSEHILVYFLVNLGFLRFVSVCFGLFRNSLFRNSLFRLFRFYTDIEIFNV